jgi:hypothetical protein
MLMLMLVLLRKADRSYGRLVGAFAVVSSRTWGRVVPT